MIGSTSDFAAPLEISTNRFSDAMPANIRKVAIIGKAPSSREFAPYDDESWEVWGVGDCALSVKRWNRSFELHDIHNGFTRWNQVYQDFLKGDHGKPIYTFENHPDVKCSTAYPRREILSEFAALISDNEGNPLPYFTNSISWMIALAIHEKVNEIGLWGVDMAQHGVGLQSEYAHQRPSCELWLGVAVGRGIKVTIHQHSDLLKTPYQYGFDSEPSAMRLKYKARTGDLETGRKKAGEKAKANQNEIRRLQGHLKYWESRLLGILGADDESETAREKIVDRMAQISAGIELVKETQNEQLQRQLVHIGAQDDMQYWHQHIFG